jgi:hypothetical protein
MSASMRAASALARAWVRLYTARLPETLRNDRRAEMDADLWEHRHDPLRRSPAVVTATEILLRILLGAVDDLGWRYEVLRDSRQDSSNQRRVPMLRLSSGQTRWMGLAGAAGGLMWATYFLSLMTRDRGDYPAAWDRYVPLVVAAFLVAGLVGFLTSYRERIGRKGTVGVSLLIASMASYFLANTVLGALPAGTARTVFGAALAIGFVILPIPGFLLVGLAFGGSARAGAFVVAAVGPLGMMLPFILAQFGIVDPEWLLPDSPVNLTYGTYFILVAAWFGAAGYATYRHAHGHA